MFQAFPLQTSLPALAVEGVRRVRAGRGTFEPWRSRVYVRQTPRAGTSTGPASPRRRSRSRHSLDGQRDLGSVAQATGLLSATWCSVVRGLELTGQVEHRAAARGHDPGPGRGRGDGRADPAQSSGPMGSATRSRTSATASRRQLLLRRTRCGLVILALDRPEHEANYRALRDQAPPAPASSASCNIEEEGELARLDALGLDGVLHRPVSEPDLRATVNHLVQSHPLAKVSWIRN